MPDPEAFLFQSREGKNQPLSYVQAWRVIKGAAKACGLDTTRISTHSLRKGFAKEVFEASGHSLPVTQKALGHTSILTTIAYLDTDQNEVDQVIRGIASRARPVESRGAGLASSA
jgi:site-specific recombinase XerD